MLTAVRCPLNQIIPFVRLQGFGSSRVALLRIDETRIRQAIITFFTVVLGGVSHTMSIRERRRANAAPVGDSTAQLHTAA